MCLLETLNLCKVYDAKGLIPLTAVDSVNLRVERGSFSVLSGPSGSGKTTLLNLIGGLDRPSSGAITLAGQELSSLQEKELSSFRLHSVGFVFQAYNLVPVLTARENIEYVMILQGVSESLRNEKVQDVSKRLGIHELLDRMPSEMSGGQQQRVAVARALLGDPEIILADEPTANLDSHNSRLLLEMMRELNETQGTTFLISSHDPMVLEMSGEKILLRDGKVLDEAQTSH
ncbi:ABC transporter ATP-binding protein [bacterium]|jgi:putative ABC transport system ATP-binding protein|nr:ABC transporter ATP-binding protein [bacterium]